jgi:23S rRNA pseudouridine1911/1915/1917 synthase
MAQTFRCVVDTLHEGERLDQFLNTQLSGYSRTFIQTLIKDGGVRDSVSLKSYIKPSFKVMEGMTFHIAVPDPKEWHLEPEAGIHFDIIDEDDHVLVIHKPYGLVVHPAPGHASGTLVNGLLHHLGNNLKNIGGIERPGIVHRLDQFTSGLMVVAKTQIAFYSLQEQLKDRSLKRGYYGLCFGKPVTPAGTIHTFFGRDPKHFEKMKVFHRSSTSLKEAITRYKIIESIPYNHDMVSLIEFSLQTGRTHQIRVHAAWKGCPIIGDLVYTPPHIHQKITHHRQALHAYHLQFIHPLTQDLKSYTIPMARDLIELRKTIFKN